MSALLYVSNLELYIMSAFPDMSAHHSDNIGGDALERGARRERRGPSAGARDG